MLFGQRFKRLGCVEFMSTAVSGSSIIFLPAKIYNWSSGGFVANSIVDTSVVSGSSQQYLIRNCTLTSWNREVLNMLFVGDLNASSGTWPTGKYTVVPTTPPAREKPYLIVDNGNNYSVVVPTAKTNSQGQVGMEAPRSLHLYPCRSANSTSHKQVKIMQVQSTSHFNVACV